MNFLDFVASKQVKENTKTQLNEAFKDSDVNKVHKLMLDLFRKKIGDTVQLLGEYDTMIEDKPMKSFIFIYSINNKWKTGWALNYALSDKHAEVYSIDFFDYENITKLFNADGKLISKLSVYTLGSSIAYFIPIICHVVNTDDFNLDSDTAKEYANTIFKNTDKMEGRKFNYGAMTYKIYENFNNNDIEVVFNNKLKMNEDIHISAEDYKDIKAQELHNAKYAAKWDLAAKLEKEYLLICAAIKGGATTMEEVQLALKHNIPVKPVNDTNTDNAENTFETAQKDPEQAFKELSMYVKSVYKGIQPGLIVAGSPGSGKTYRIIKQLNAAGYNDDNNMYIIKGKCSTRSLYTTLYNYRNQGQIVVIDDADGLIGPKAPEECINILKAALDSSGTDEGRKISYKITGEILDDEKNSVPKSFMYNGGCIVITNYSVGQIDTAIRNRVFVQSIDFTIDQMLDMIKELIPSIDNKNLTMVAKNKAYDYLCELNAIGSPLEISIRSFCTCARIFTMCAGDSSFSDEDAKSMIAEQMRNQSLKNGRHF